MNRTHLCFAFFYFLLGSAAFSQTWNWANSIGGTKSDKAITIKTDPNDDVIVSGYFSENMSLGNGINLVKVGNGKDIFIAKYNNLGVCQWGKSGGDFFDDRILGMDIDPNGNTTITGTCWNNITFGSIGLNAPNAACCDQCFVYKLDPLGNVLWGQMAGAMGDDQGLDLITDNAGNSYIGGFMSGDTILFSGTTMTLAGANSGSHVYNYWVAKIDGAGNWVWAVSFGNLPWDPATNKYVERDIALSLDQNGNIFVTGGFDGTRIFGNDTLTSLGGTDVFLSKINPNGTMAWAVSGGSDKDDWANSVAADSLGNVYVTGEHRDSLYFGTTLIKNFKKRDIFVAKFNANDGACIWGKRGGSDEGSERGNDIYADKNCNVYVTGEVGKKGKFGPIITDSVGTPHIFVSRISPDGDWLWATTGGTIDSADSRSNSICPGRNNALYICGNYTGFGNFGASPLSSAGKTDAFIAQLVDNDPHQNCASFVLPFVNAGILSLQSPSDTICSNKIYPAFTLTNIGNLPLTSATIGYTVDGSAPIFYNWTGNLDSLESDLVVLPSSFITPGNHTITIFITLANGVADGYTANNQWVASFYVTTVITQALPFFEGFESPIFPANNITTFNPDGGITWESTNLAAFLGLQSCRIRNFDNLPIGEIDELQLPALDLYNANFPQMSFDYAYSPFTQGASDTLTILISTDCGETYQTLTKMFGAGLQTANATTSPFVPNAIQWKNKALSLTAYANNPYAKIIFRNTSSHENNLYIDNINILGSPTGIENMSNSIPLSLFPNPAYGKVNVTYPMLEGNSEVLIEMIDMAGKTVQVWKEKATHGVNQWELQLPDASKGVYLLRFQNGYHTQAERLIVE